MISPFHSIRWRLQLWHGLILLLALGGVCVAVYQMTWMNQLRRIDRGLMENDRAVIIPIAMTPTQTGEPRMSSQQEMIERLKAGEVELPANVMTRFEGTLPGYAYFAIRANAGPNLLESRNAPRELLFLPTPTQEMMAEEARFVGNRREIARSSEHGLSSVFGRDISPDLEEMHKFAWSLAAAALTVWILGLLGGWWLAGKAMRPIDNISRTASRIAKGNLLERIETEGGASELDQLAAVLNGSFDQLQAVLEKQRQFTADAAHELRTPLTILTTETQRILKKERSGEEYREAFKVCEETVGRMRRLVGDLLLLAKQEGVDAQFEVCDISEILTQAANNLRPLANAKHITLRLNLQQVRCDGKPASLAIVANNLIANAIQHHPGPGNIYLSSELNLKSGNVRFAVRDDGPGISEDDLPQIYDRFYRADKARAANTALHTGLGLAIVKTIVESHGGTIECRSSVGKGAEFVVELPK